MKIKAISTALLTTTSAFGDHGPGTSGGGAATQSAETLKPGKVAIDFRTEFTEFENLSSSEVEDKARRAGAFDMLDRSYLHTVALSYGIVENLQATLSIGYYDAEDAREAEFDPIGGETEILTFDPDGVTDLWLTGKYRFYRGPIGQFAVYGGVKFPTGKDDVENSEGERVEPSATAGSGSFDGLVGLAYSRFLTSQITVDTSAHYIFRTEHDNFRLGDRIDAGTAIAYRFTEDIEKFPQFSVFAEANLRHLLKSEEDGDRDPNTGGTVLFLAPGARAAFTRNLALTVWPQFPVYQDLNGEQLETNLKINAALTVSF
jgi:outer membrane putative beta-barrel porin/alpha-amylase